MTKEQKITRTFKELAEIDNLVGIAYQLDPKLELTKFGYAYKRFAEKSFYPKVKEKNEELGFLRIDNALEDEKTKEVLVDRENPRGFKFSKDGLKKTIKEESALAEKWNTKEIEVEPYISTYTPEEISNELKELLKGLVL